MSLERKSMKSKSVKNENVTWFDGYVTKEDLRSALAKAGWNKAKAARILGVTRTTVWRNIKKYGLREETSQDM